MDQQNIKMEKVLYDNGNSCENEVDDNLEDGEILDEEYDTKMGKSTKKNTELKASKKNCLEENTKEKKLNYYVLPCEVSVPDHSVIHNHVRGGNNNPDLSKFRDSKNKVNEELEDGEILDEEFTDLSHLAESSEKNTELKASKKNCLREGAKQKNVEHSWDIDQRHQQSSHQQIIHAPLHNNFSRFNNNRSRDRIPKNKRVKTKRDLSYERDDDRGRKRLKVDQNDEDNERTNEEEKCTFVHRELTCKYCPTNMKCYSSVSCQFSHGKIDEEQKRKILKNNLEKKPLLSMQTYDQPFLDDLSDDDEFNDLVIDEDNFQNDVKDQLLPEKQKEQLNNNGNSCKNEVDEDLKDGEIFDEEYNTEMAKLTEKNTESKKSKENCLEEDIKEKKMKYYMLPCEVSVRDYSDIPPTMGVEDPRLRNTIIAAKDPLYIQNTPIHSPFLQTPNSLQPPPMDIDMRHMLPPIMTCPQTMPTLNDSRRKPVVPRDPRLEKHRFDVDQRLNNKKFFF